MSIIKPAVSYHWRKRYPSDIFGIRPVQTSAGIPKMLIDDFCISYQGFQAYFETVT
jgi:hypothetical protein